MVCRAPTRSPRVPSTHSALTRILATRTPNCASTRQLHPTPPPTARAPPPHNNSHVFYSFLPIISRSVCNYGTVTESGRLLRLCGMVRNKPGAATPTRERVAFMHTNAKHYMHAFLGGMMARAKARGATISCDGAFRSPHEKFPTALFFFPQLLHNTCLLQHPGCQWRSLCSQRMATVIGGPWPMCT